MAIPLYCYRIAQVTQKGKTRKYYDLDPTVEGAESKKGIGVTDLIWYMHANRISNAFSYSILPKGNKNIRHIVEICDDINDVVLRLRDALSAFPVLFVKCMPVKYSKEAVVTSNERGLGSENTIFQCYKFYSHLGIDVTYDLMCLCYIITKYIGNALPFHSIEYEEYCRLAHGLYVPGFFFTSSDSGVVFATKNNLCDRFDALKSICDFIRIINAKLYLLGLAHSPLQIGLQLCPFYSYIVDSEIQGESFVEPIYLDEYSKLIIECCLANNIKPSELLDLLLNSETSHETLLLLLMLFGTDDLGVSSSSLIKEVKESAEELDTAYSSIHSSFVMFYDEINTEIEDDLQIEGDYEEDEYEEEDYSDLRENEIEPVALIGKLYELLERDGLESIQAAYYKRIDIGSSYLYGAD